MTHDDLQQQAREAVETAWPLNPNDSISQEMKNRIRRVSFERGYIAAAEPREKAIQSMKDACQKWEWNSAETMAVLMGCEAKVAMQKEEIAALRARVAELEEGE